MFVKQEVNGKIVGTLECRIDASEFGPDHEKDGWQGE